MFRFRNDRHLYTSRALALGESLPMIVCLLGRSEVETTARFARQAEDSVRDAAVRVSAGIAADFLVESGSAAPEPGLSFRGRVATGTAERGRKRSGRNRPAPSPSECRPR